MSGSKASFNHNFTENYAFTICKKMSCELRSGFCAKTNGCASGFGKFKMARQEVSVKMCFENMGDCEIQFACTVKVLVNVALWVYDNRAAS
jgi:hypothetical protein